MQIGGIAPFGILIRCTELTAWRDVDASCTLAGSHCCPPPAIVSPIEPGFDGPALAASCRVVHD